MGSGWVSVWAAITFLIGNIYCRLRGGSKIGVDAGYYPLGQLDGSLLRTISPRTMSFFNQGQWATERDKSRERERERGIGMGKRGWADT